MRSILSNFFTLLFFISSPVYAESFYKEFSIKVSGLKIGELVWALKMDNNNYSNDIKLKSKGLLSAIYSFEGVYSSKAVSYTHLTLPTKA